MWLNVGVVLLLCFLKTDTLLYPILDPTHLYVYTPPEDEITFHLYHFNDFSRNDELFVDDVEKLESSRFNEDLPTKILIHGWTHSKDAPWLKEMREAMSLRDEWNVIVVDWSPLARVIYVEARVHTPTVAKQVANFCLFLHRSKNISMSSIHLIGHSMGGQISAFAGYKVAKETGYKLGRITALDPAAPLYEWPHMEYKDEVLDPSDATFVDVIHTNGRHLGMITPAGHVDFYPNGGEHQPGCGFWICSHLRACEFWTASVKKPDLFYAYSFKSWNKYSEGKIEQLHRYPMGIDAGPDIPSGTYFLETDDEFKQYIDARTTIKDSYDMSNYKITYFDKYINTV